LGHPGTAQVDAPLRGFLALGGELGAAMAAALVEALDRSASTNRRGPLVAAGYGALVIAVGWAATWVEWGEPAGDSFRAAVAQGNVEMRGEHRALTVGSLRVDGELSRQAVEESGAQVVVWGESAVRAPIDQVSRCISGMRTAAQSLGIEYIFGARVSTEAGATELIALVIGRQESRNVKRGLIPVGTDPAAAVSGRAQAPECDALTGAW
jgi:apolipoprotein N-acyltransferase